MAKKNNTYLIVGVVVTVVIALYIYMKCKISCASPESYLYEEHLDSRRLVDDHNICGYDVATGDHKCRSTGLRCNNPGEYCGPLTNCGTTDMCCGSGNGMTGKCRGTGEPCYDVTSFLCGGSHGTKWY